MLHSMHFNKEDALVHSKWKRLMPVTQSS